LLVTYLLWMGASLGWLGNGVGGIVTCLVVVTAVSGWLGRGGLLRDAGGTRPLLTWLLAKRRLIVITELLFLVALAGWALVRSYSPEITTAGGEKFMELAFLNGILRSPHFPPLDPWLSGFAISYYYFGYVMLAVLTRLSGLMPSVAFNVGLATWFALTITAAFGIAYDLVAALVRWSDGHAGEGQAVEKPPASALAGGLLGALFVGVLSNLEGFLESMQGLGLGSLAFWRWLDIKDLNCLAGPNYVEALANCPETAGIVPQRFFWWWRASRVINDRDLLGNAVEVIDEFPFFSFLLGDMHPHVLALPFVLLAIGLALALVLGAAVYPSKRAGVGEVYRVHPWIDEVIGFFSLGWVGYLLYALCLGALAFLNTWDFPIYVFLVMLSLAASLAWQENGWSWSILGRALLAGLGLGLLGGVLYLPFYIGFQSQAGGILPNFLFPTRLAQLLVMFGSLLVPIFFLLLALSRDTAHIVFRRTLALLPWTVLIPVLFLLLTLAVGLWTPFGQDLVRRLLDMAVVREQTGSASLAQLAVQVLRHRILTPWAFLLLAGLLAWIMALVGMRVTRPKKVAMDGDNALTVEAAEPIESVVPYASPAGAPASWFVLLALLTAFLLVFSVEFVYLRDTFGTRMNTVFKFYFQAWVLMGLVAAYSVIYLAYYGTRLVRALGLTMTMLVLIAGLFYPVFGTYTRAERFAKAPTLDGTAYLARQNPADMAAIQWLRANVPGQATVLEAYGGSYSYHGRLSAQTGLPTLLGWEGHQLQWRGNTIEQDKRRPDVDRIYRNASVGELDQLLDRWDIDYVVVGDLERRTFGITPQTEARLEQAMNLVYDLDGVRIYQRRS
jgi:YYY domain-containing protein